MSRVSAARVSPKLQRLLAKDRPAVRPGPPEPGKAASAARLHYVSDGAPGIGRVKAGSGFRYRRADGRWLEDPVVLARIRRLAIPPAWTGVWICPRADGHLQATGRDARQRKQYRYHARWREVRDRSKFGRMIDFAQALPHIRKVVAEDLRRPGLPREKVLATVVRLLETTCIRVGGDEYARQNRHFGLTTLLDRHVDVAGAELRFHFCGKSGRQHSVRLHDPRLARIVHNCQEIPGQRLFQCVDGHGARHAIGSADVNAYLKTISGGDFTAKDFRTWAGTTQVATALMACTPPLSAAAGQRQVLAAIDRAAERLGNTRTVCRSSYVHPSIIDAFLEGWLQAPPRVLHARIPAGLDRQEAAAYRVLLTAAHPAKGRAHR